MANPTTNYGWPMPTATDLVTDLPADFAAFGQPVDTSLKALNPETTLGDIAYRSSTANTNTRLPIGTSGQVLAVSGGGVPAWTTTADVTPLTTKGDLFTFTTVDARLGVGANNTVLTADSAEATGLKWTTPATGGGITLLSTTNLSGTETSVTGISGSYKNLIVVMQDYYLSADANVRFKINTDTTSNNYRGLYNYVNFGASPVSSTAYISSTTIPDCSNEQTSTSDDDRISILTIYGYSTSSSTKLWTVQTKNRNPGAEYSFGAGWGYWGNTGQNAVTSIQATTFTGTPTWSGGTITIYGES